MKRAMFTSRNASRRSRSGQSDPSVAPLRIRLTVGWLSALALVAMGSVADGANTANTANTAKARVLRTATAQSSSGLNSYLADAYVEAVRDSRIAAQVSGRITELSVRAGDRVPAGQVLLRIDPSVAAQQVAVSQAQAAQAQAMLSSARADYARAQRLYADHAVSAAALEHADTQLKSAEAQARALNAQATATGVQAGYYTVRAPYAGWVAQVNVALGDTAAPGVPLLQMYDPTALRVTVQLPESVVARLDRSAAASVEFPDGTGGASGSRRQTGLRVTVLPALDAATHSATVRVDLPPQGAGVLPGQFARVTFALKGGASGVSGLSARSGLSGESGASSSATPPSGEPQRVWVPQSAVVQRGELSAIYVVDAQERVQLRQIRLGRASGDRVEVLAGVSAGEQVALDPVAAAQATAR